MDPQNSQTQVPSVTPPTTPVVNIPSEPVAPPPMVETTQETPPPPSVTPTVPPIEGKPAGGSSMVMKVAIWLMVIALVVVLGYVAYVQFLAPAPAPVATETVAPLVTESPTPIATESASPSASPTASGSATPHTSASPTATP